MGGNYLLKDIRYILRQSKKDKDIMKKSFFKNPLTILTFIVPPIAVAVILLIVYAMGRMYPFGDKTLAWCDMHQQVVPLLLNFKDILQGEGNFFLNMQNAAGMNFYGVFLFFISSPFSFLVVFIEKADIMNFMNILTLLKMATCAITANIYFRRCHKRLHLFWGALFSVVYAFSGYAMLFYQNTVWLDVMYFFPLLLISFDSLIKNKRTGGLIFCLSGMLVLNYYLSYMVVIFTIIYFGLYLFMNRRRETVNGIAPRFIIACAVAAALTAVIWLPSFAQYLSSARGKNIIKGLVDSQIFTKLDTCLPFLFCTGVALAVYVIFFGRRVTSESRFYVILSFLTLLPVILEPINKMWHTGDYMAFPVRYGYITTMMLLCFGAVKLGTTTIRDFGTAVKKRYAIPTFMLIALFGGFSVWYYLTFRDKLDSYSTTLWGNTESFLYLLIITCIAVTLYTLIFSFGVFRKLGFTVLCIMLSVVTAFECLFNANVYIAAASYTPSKFDNAIVLEDKIQDDEKFWRIKLGQGQYKYFDANLIGGLGYNSFAHYTSLTSEDYMFAMKRLGYSSYWMEVTGNGGTLLTDAMMSVGYTVEKFTAREPALYRDKYYSIFENEYFMPLGIISDNDLSAVPELPLAERNEIQQFVAEQLFGAEEELFTEYQPTGERNIQFYKIEDKYHFIPEMASKNAALTYKIYVEGKQTLYFDCFDLVSTNVREHIYGTFDVYVNGVKENLSFPGQDTNGLLDLGVYENEFVTVEISLNKKSYCSSFGLYGLSHEKLGKIINPEKSAGLEVSGTTISGSYNCEKDGQYLFLSVPYDKGFTAYVNGKETEISRTLGGFMAIRLSQGENDIEFSFSPTGFKMGVIISFAGVVMLALWLVLRKRAEKLLDKSEKICRIGVYLLFSAVLAIIYLVPMILCITGTIIDLL